MNNSSTPFLIWVGLDRLDHTRWLKQQPLQRDAESTLVFLKAWHNNTISLREHAVMWLLCRKPIIAIATVVVSATRLPRGRNLANASFIAPSASGNNIPSRDTIRRHQEVRHPHTRIPEADFPSRSRRSLRSIRRPSKPGGTCTRTRGQP